MGEKAGNTSLARKTPPELRLLFNLYLPVLCFLSLAIETWPRWKARNAGLCLTLSQPTDASHLFALFRRQPFILFSLSPPLCPASLCPKLQGPGTWQATSCLSGQSGAGFGRSDTLIQQWENSFGLFCWIQLSVFSVHILTEHTFSCKYSRLISSWFSVSICVHVCVREHFRGQTIVLNLGSLTDHGAHWFGFTYWPASLEYRPLFTSPAMQPCSMARDFWHWCWGWKLSSFVLAQ